ncbi:cytochrome P450 [Chytridium lagenaria]|nr:cytochrome P450 [Chytridium lagenaria]
MDLAASHPHLTILLGLGIAAFGLDALYPRKSPTIPYTGFRWPFIGHMPEILAYARTKKHHERMMLIKKNIGGIAKSELPGGMNWSNMIVPMTVGMFAYGLFIMPTDDIWKKHRKFLQPGFGPSHLRRAIEVTNDVMDTLLNVWAQRVDEFGDLYETDIFHIASSITVDIIGQVAFSYDYGCIKNHENPESLTAMKAYQHSFEVINIRFSVPSFLWGFVGVSVSSGETSANTIVFAILELDRHPENMSSKETLRLYPVVAVPVGRVALKTTELAGHRVDKGTIVCTDLINLHRDEKYWRHPLAFSPSRWVDFTPTPGTYLPFGEGAHACIGQKLAMIELKTVLSRMFRDFVPSVVSGQDLDPITSVTHGLKNGLKGRRHRYWWSSRHYKAQDDRVVAEEEPTYHDPLKDIDDIVGCSEKRVVYPRNNRNVNIFSNVKHFNILVTGNAFAAISISADEVEPYIQISTHFHSSSIHDSDLNVEYTETKDNKAESVATLIVKSPSVILTESCIVATVIIKIPAVISQGMSMNINGSKIGVDGRFKKIRVARLTLSAELLLARILNIEILDLLKIKAGNGAIAVYESKIGEADVNMKNGETTLLKSVVTSAATTSVYGDINVIDSAIVNNLELSSAYGSFNVSSVNVKGKLKATTDSGTIVANGIHGPFRGLFFETIDRPIHLEKLNASIMAKGASINLRSKLAQIQVDLVS